MKPYCPFQNVFKNLKLDSKLLRQILFYITIVSSYSSFSQSKSDFKSLDSLILRLNNHSKKTETGNETVQYYAAMFYT
ncbi:MAG: hypothetical protein ACK53Y_16000, partial [bacterium]